jgi:hypothetical protein
MNPAIKRGLKILVFGAIGGGLAAVVPFLNANPTLYDIVGRFYTAGLKFQF